MKNSNIHKYLSKKKIPTRTPQKVVIGSSLNLTLLWSMICGSAPELGFS
jgi:hypothetical protein